MEKPEPESSDESAMGSWVEVAAEVEEVLETTEALWAARRRESSRVSRFTYQRDISLLSEDKPMVPQGRGTSHTTASCSFSSCIWSSDAVSGRGCRKGPGPGPTPLSCDEDW